MLSLAATLITAALVLVALLLILLVLMQRPRQEGLSPAIGAGLTEHIWGPQTPTVLHRGTVWLGTLLFVLSLSLAMVKKAQHHAEYSLTVPVAVETSGK